VKQLSDRAAAAAGGSRRDHPDIVQNCSVCSRHAASSTGSSSVSGVQSCTNSHRQVTDRPHVNNHHDDDDDDVVVARRQNTLESSQFDHF